LLAVSLLEPSLTKSRRPSVSHAFWWWPPASHRGILRQLVYHCSV
jgi:hypothetical protein